MLVAASLTYVYERRLVMSAGMPIDTGGGAPSEFRVDSVAKLRMIFGIHGVGFAVLAAIIAWMNAQTLRKAADLPLGTEDRLAACAKIAT